MRDSVNFQSDIEKANYINNVLKELTEVNDEIRIEIILKSLQKSSIWGIIRWKKSFLTLKITNLKKRLNLCQKIHRKEKINIDKP